MPYNHIQILFPIQTGGLDIVALSVNIKVVMSYYS